MSFPHYHDLPAPPSYWSRHRNIEWPPKSGHKAGSVWIHKIMGLQVIRSMSVMIDGSEWIHVSVARRSKMPGWEDLSKVKKDFIGEDREAYQIMAKAADHVNIHQFCLHLWSPLNEQRNGLEANLQSIEREDSI